MRKISKDFTNTVKVLGDAQRLILLTHRRPDGDTLGSAAALCRGLRLSGKEAWLWPNPDLTPRFETMTAGLWAEADMDTEGCLIVAVDVADRALLPKNTECFETIHLAIDHHPSNKGYAGQALVCPFAAACGEIVYDLLCEMGVALDEEMATALYTALATDTGCFVFDNTTPRTHEVAAACMAAGADFKTVNYQCFRLKTRARAALESHIYGSMELIREGRGGVCLLLQETLAQLKATDDDADNLASLISQVEGVEIGALLTEVKGGGAYKVSMRTRIYDASRVCGRFGGGGHAGAAGCTLSGMTAEEAVAAIRKALEDTIDA